MALWNQKKLPAPPTITYKSETKDLDLVKLRNALQDCIKHFKNEDFMIRETALLSRILYRMKMKFRSCKEFKSLEKINHSLNIYLNSNMSRALKNIYALTPLKYELETYLPTRNMLSYILVKIQGLVKLMDRIYDTCQVAAYEINQRIAIGHFWKIYIVLFSLVSRIYILVKYNTKLLCELYGKLLPHSYKLENTGRNWLPPEYNLPSDLREWLGVQWVYEEEFVDLTLEPSIKILNFFNLVNDDDDDEVQFCDEYILIDEEDTNIANDFKKLKPVEETFTRNRMRGFSINEDDIGEDLADIIKLDDTAVENIVLRNTKHEEEMGSHFKDTNQNLAIEDVGEEMSSTEKNSYDKLKIVNLHGTEYNLNLPSKKINSTGDNIGSKQSPQKRQSKDKKNKIKNTINDTVINLADDSEIIVIPETPARKTPNNLDGTSIILLDDTLVNKSPFSETIKDTVLNSNKKIKKKKKDKSVKIKKTVAYTFPTTNNLIENFNDQNNKGTLLVKGNIPLPLNNSSSQTSQSPLKKKKLKTLEKTPSQLNNKGKIDENCTLTTNDDKGQKKRKREQARLSKKNITKSQEQDNIDNKFSAVDVTPKKKKEKKRNNINSCKQNKTDDYKNSREYRKFNSTLKALRHFLTERSEESTEDTCSAGPSKEAKSSKYNKKNTNLVRLTLVKEIPGREHKNQKEASVGQSQSEGNSFKDDKNVNSNLIPCLDTPLKGTLNMDRKTMTEDTASSSTVIHGKSDHNVSPEIPENEEFKKKKGKKRKLEESMSTEIVESSFTRHKNRKRESISKFFRHDIEQNNHSMSLSTERVEKPFTKQKNRSRESKFFRNDAEQDNHNVSLEISEYKKGQQEKDEKRKFEESPSLVKVEKSFTQFDKPHGEPISTFFRNEAEQDSHNVSLEIRQNKEFKKEKEAAEIAEKSFTKREERNRERISKFFRNDAEQIRPADYERKELQKKRDKEKVYKEENAQIS